MSKPGQPFGEWLTERIAEFFDSDVEFAAAAGLKSSGSVTHYKRGTIPKPATLKQMAPALRISARALMAIAYPDLAGHDDDEAPAAPVRPDVARHPLARDLDRLLSPDSRVPPEQREALSALVDNMISPYRRYLRTRKVS